MKYDIEVIKDKFREFWPSVSERVKFYINGKRVFPNYIPFVRIEQIEEYDGGEDYNFKCHTLNLKVMIDNLESSYISEFYLKVDIEYADGPKKLPEEKISYIKDNRIALRPR